MHGMWSKGSRPQENLRSFFIPCLHDEGSTLQMWGVGHSTSQHYRAPSVYKTDQCSSWSCQRPSHGTLRNVQPAVSQGQHSATQGNSTRDYLAKKILGAKKSFWKGPPSGTVGVSLPLGGLKDERHRRLTVCAGVGTSTTSRYQEIRQKLLYERSLTITKPNGKSYDNSGPQLYAPTIRTTADATPPPTLTSCRRDEVCMASGSSGCLHRGRQSAVTPQDGTTRPTATRPLGSLCRLGPNRGTTWMYVTCDPAAAPRLAYRDNEYSPLNLHFWALRRDIQVGNGAETVGQDHGDRQDPCWWGRSCINLNSPKN
jgi:hypothetical protein